MKYWGIRDPERALPYNSSLSVTLDRLRTRTTVRFEPGLDLDEFELNGAPAAAKAAGSVTALLDRVRTIAQLDLRARVASSNNFPTASGLASSASGFAALAGAATAAAGLDWSPRQVSQLARFGSGSACRSIFGGFVEWQAGSAPDGSDCFARPLFPESHWPELRDLVLLVEDAPEKEVRSAEAMQATVATSPEFAQRQREVPNRLARIHRAIGDRDAATLFPLVMEECDNFRKVCETTRPSLDYLTGTTRSLLEAVRALNQEEGRPVAGYTHDAGAHLHVFVLDKDGETLRRRLRPIAGVRETLLLHAGPGGRRTDEAPR